jgi:hypothetical protein
LKKKQVFQYKKALKMAFKSSKPKKKKKKKIQKKQVFQNKKNKQLQNYNFCPKAPT